MFCYCFSVCDGFFCTPSTVYSILIYILLELYSFLKIRSHPVIQHDKNSASSSQMSQTVLRCFTWAEGLQEPGASHSAWCAGCRLGGVEGSDRLDIGLVVTCSGDLQHRDNCTLVQQTVGRHHFSVALLTATHSRLTQEGRRMV